MIRKAVARRGFTMLEVVVTMAIMGVATVTITRAVVDIRRTSADSFNRAVAHTIARNEVERLKEMGTLNPERGVGEFLVDQEGGNDPTGGYKLSVEAETICAGGEWTKENQREVDKVADDECVGEKAILAYRVTVTYASRLGVAPRTIEYTVALGQEARYGGTGVSEVVR
jgi:prepilin-type N-terminal cleavage/methylation domain-containing protein